MKKLAKLDFMKMKSSGEPLAWVTAYDYPTVYAA